ncbi:MAG: NERD domain-containing protein [Oscillospiraceae bacterium]|nr:NERD domain-containing protein [Oscillospiraceae bacterium]
MFWRLIKNFFRPSSEELGKIGEVEIESKLRSLNFWGYKGRKLNDIYIPYKDDMLSQIDVLYITKKGLFVMESKNYSGYIFGDEKNAKWTSTLYGGKTLFGRSIVEKHSFYNPIWQNRTHIKAIKQYIGAGENVPFFSIIVFSDRCNIKSLNYLSPDVYVCYASQFSKLLKRIWKKYPDVLTEEQINSMHKRLSAFSNPDKAVKEYHKAMVYNRMVNNDKCPVCSGELVLRTSKRGTNAGHQFYGCSNFPRCRYTKSISQHK